MYIRKKAAVLIITYLTAAILALGGVCIYLSALTKNLRLSAENGYRHAVSELVGAENSVSEALRCASFASGRRMSAAACARLSSACTLAGMHLAELPMSTHELYKTAGFLGRCLALSNTALVEKPEGFDTATREAFSELYTESRRLSDELSDMGERLGDGRLRLDSPEEVLNRDGEGELFSHAMQKLEESIEDEKTEEAQKLKPIGDSEALRLAAEFFGLTQDSLELKYHAENGGFGIGGEGVFILLDPKGRVLSLSSERAVSGDMEAEELRDIARNFLREHGFENLTLVSEARSEGVHSFSFSRLLGGIRSERGTLRLALATDDGSVYSYFAGDFLDSENETPDKPKLSSDEAKRAIPSKLRAESRGLILARDGEGSRLCYDFSCTDTEGESLRILVDAKNGEQFRIDI